VNGRAAATGELQHVTDVVGLTAMWLLGPRLLPRMPRVFGRGAAA
jgi:hypothetical protein